MFVETAGWGVVSGRRATNLAGERILVAEDEFFIADDIRAALVGSGAEVLGPVPTCAEALAVMSREDRIDGAVLDIHLGDGLAFPIADALAERGVPFIFATGYDEAIVPDRFRTVPRWEKPFDLSKVVDALQQVVGPRRIES